MAVPEFQYAQWGNNLGQNLVQGMQQRRELQTKNALAAALPGALSGDEAALKSLYAANPETGLKVQSYLAERGDAAAKLTREQDKESLGMFQDELAGTIASVAQLPPEQQPQAWSAYEAMLAKKYPKQWDGTPDPWDQAKASAFQLAAKDKRYADVFSRVGLLPQEPSDTLAKIPSTVQEWKYFTQLPPDQQRQFLTMKRADKILDAGPAFYRADPTGMTAPSPVLAKGLDPGDLPGVRGAQAQAAEEGKGRGAVTTTNLQRTRSADDAIGLLDEAEAILSEKGTTGSAAGSIVDTAAGVVGKSTAGAQNTAKLKTIAGQLVAKMPRMEGPQSNYDVQLYQEMAGQLANPTTPTATRLAAAGQIRRLQQKYASGMADTTAPPTVRKRYNPETGRIE